MYGNGLGPDTLNIVPVEYGGGQAEEEEQLPPTWESLPYPPPPPPPSPSLAAL